MVATVEKKADGKNATSTAKVAAQDKSGTAQDKSGTQTPAQVKAAEQQAKKKAAMEKAAQAKGTKSDTTKSDTTKSESGATSSQTTNRVVQNKTEKKATGTMSNNDSGTATSAEKSKSAEKNGSKAASKKTPRKKKAGKAKDKIAALIEQNSTLMAALQQIEKQFGEGSIMPLGAEQRGRIEGISTGSLSIDIALGGQGIPRGRIIEVFGPESSGKTTFALHCAAKAQENDGIAAIIDAEHAFDPSWAKKLGVDLDTLLVSQPSSGEEAMQICEMLVKSSAVDVVIIDSVAALVPRRELEGEIGDSHVGLQARLMSQSMRKLTGAIAKSKTAVIFINQIREKVGVVYGSPEVTPGGRALKFYSSCRIEVRRIAQLKDGEDIIGQRVRAKIVKNKVAPPFRVAEVDMLHANGISYEGDVLDLATAHKVVSRSGAWYKYGEDYLGQGKEKARQHLMENPEVTAEIHAKVMEMLAENSEEEAAVAEPNEEK